MKKIICIILASVATYTYTYAQSIPYQHLWKSELNVMDDIGKPVQGALAHVFYLGTNEFSGKTDTNGVFVASHQDGSESLAFYVEMPGYYPSRITYHMGRKYQAGTWNPKQAILLKKITNPIPMYAKRVNAEPPVNNRAIGYDLMIGDWIAPYGKGISTDIAFTCYYKKKSLQDYDYQLTVAFPNTDDGIQEFVVPKYYLNTHGSALRSNQEAPAEGYQPNLKRVNISHPGQKLISDYNENRAYYFRVHTVLDEKGKVKSALYGKIYGDFMDFCYYLNPTPNDRNVEFDPAHNLIKGLKSLEIVPDP